MVPPGNERRTGRRAQRGRVDIVVAQTVIRDTIHRGRRDNSTEGAGNAKSGIIRDDKQHVGRSLGRHDARRPPRFRLQRIVLDHTTKFRVGCRKFLAADSGCGAGRPRCASGLQLTRLIGVFVGI